MAPQREWFEKDYYRVLGVSETATAKEIKSAYRKLSREYHPDTNPGDAAAEERFKEVSAAYDVVGNDERRKEYDEVRRLGPAGAGFPGGGGPGRVPVPGRGRPRRSARRAVRPAVAAGVAEVAGRTGARTSRPSSTSPSTMPSPGSRRRSTSPATPPCRTCSGSGAKAGTVPHRCTNCGGQGVVSDNQGLFSLSSPCPVCAGRGSHHRRPVPDVPRHGGRAPTSRGQGAGPGRAWTTASASD